MGNMGYTTITEQLLGLFSYIITHEGEWQSLQPFNLQGQSGIS